MKTKNLFLSSKVAIANAFKAAAVAISSIALVAILMTIASNIAYSNTIRNGIHPLQPLDQEHCGNVLDDAQFKIRYDAIAIKYFEATKVTMSRELMNEHCLTSAQVRDLMKLFSFDPTRIEFAGEAIYKVVDPQNFDVCKEAMMLGANRVVMDDLIKDYEAKVAK